MSDGARIGVALSSGGIRGVYAHTGFLLALEQLGLPIAALVGCSAGAVVGGIAASGADLHAWSRALARVKRAEYWTPDPLWRFIWRIVAHRGRGYTGLSDTEAAAAFCRRHLAATRIQGCRYPFHTLAVNLGSGVKTMFSGGELLPRILASAAMPVLYRPVAIEGELYCDGALLDLLPSPPGGVDHPPCRGATCGDAGTGAALAGTLESVRGTGTLALSPTPLVSLGGAARFSPLPVRLRGRSGRYRAATAGVTLAPDRRRPGGRDRREYAGAGAAAAARRGAGRRSAHAAAAAGCRRSPAQKDELRADLRAGRCRVLYVASVWVQSG